MNFDFSLDTPPYRPPRILRIDEVSERIGLSRATIYRLMDLGMFPKNFRIGLKAVGWLQSEVERWITERQILGITV
ncbi:MAG: AlpA family phage regulatory protein [Sideroxydans sp.]